MDSLGYTDSRRRHTHMYTRDFPPTVGKIAYCQRTPRVRRSAEEIAIPFIKLDILIQFEYINSIRECSGTQFCRK